MAAALEVNQAYVTLFHGVFDPATGELDYIDAGHGHARLVRGAGGQDLLDQRGAPIGLLPDVTLAPGKVTLNQGDMLVIFSDGLLDLRPDLATKDVPLPVAARRAAHAQETVDLAEGVDDEPGEGELLFLGELLLVEGVKRWFFRRFAPAATVSSSAGRPAD